jgi:CubicO group peptidase (beta-lactamase class C family)
MDLQKLLDEAAVRHRAPGAAIAVGVGDELAEAATGVLNVETGVAATTDSVFQIGSVTKVWTAALVMQLVGEGLVDLDAPVRRYLPEFGLVDPVAAETVTVRQLLSHTGGFVGDIFDDTGRGDDAIGRLLELMHTAATQVSPPGALYSYSNASFCALGALVARLRGGTWESVLRERLLDPLGCTHVALFAEEAILFRASAGHWAEPDVPRRVFARWQLPRSNGPAGSSPCAAPRELVRFGRMLLADGLAEDGTRVLPAGTFAAMREAQVTLPTTGGRFTARCGLALNQYDWDDRLAVVGHDGDVLGQSATWRIVPDRDVVVAVTVNGGNTAAFFDEVLTAVLAETAGVRVPARPQPPASPAAFDAAPLVGRYFGPLAAYEVSAVDGGLDISVFPQGAAAEIGEPPSTARYVALSEDRFIAVEPSEGIHPVLAFLEGGRYLYTGRALPRVR